MSKLQRDTINIWFPDQKEPIYDPNDFISQYQFKEYWKKERDRQINGFYLADGQVFVPGFLYWHTVYWKIAMYVPVIEGSEKKVRIIDTPYLRDIEWDISGDLERAIDEGRFYDLVGSRDFGKSIIAASRAAWTYTFFSNSETVISSSEYNYIKLATDKIEDGLTNLHPALKKQRLASDWKKEIKAGWKDKKTGLPSEKSSNSKILVRNYEHGSKTMAANGTRPAFHLIDEIGTLENLIGCLKDSDGCWWSGGGTKPSALVMLTGCVCAGTKVYTADGRVINIENLQQKDGIIGFDGKQSVPQIINWFKVPETKACYRITTDNNTILECSYDHPLLITRRKFYRKIKGENLKKLIYQEAKDIKVNDQIITPSKVAIFGTHIESDARLIGLLIGDGNYTKGSTPTLSCSEKEIYDYVGSQVSSINKEYEISEGRFYSQLGLASIKSKLIEIGIYGQVKFNKRLPKNIHLYDKKSICELLAGYFDADGNVYHNSKKGIVRVVLTSVVYELLEQVKYQLLKLGIHCSILKENRNQTPPKGYEGQQDHIYRLYITQQQDVQLFKENIHLLVDKKRENLKYVKESKYKLFEGIFEINPLNNKEGYFNREDNSNLLENLRYETIKRIEYIGDRPVYNLNCNENHNYISNSFITRQTGGDMDKGAEAGEVFFNPAGYNMLEFEDEWEHSGKIGRFISALRAKQKFKEPKTLSEYLGISHPDLDRITILVSNQQRAKEEWWDVEYAKVLKTGNSKAVLKFRAYWPLVPSDSFIVLSLNDFNTDAAKEQQDALRNQDYKGTAVELYEEGGKIHHKFSNKIPITQFPLKDQSPDAPIVIYEFPMEDPPSGLYTAGVDSYRQEQAGESESLGSVYIYKRMHDITGEGYQEMFVASYTSRPANKKDWEKQAELLIRYYNATALVENDEMSFIEYMFYQKKDIYLADTPEWYKLVVPNTKMKPRKKGVSRQAQKMITHLNGQLKDYLDEPIFKGVDELSGKEVDVLGVSRVFDPMLLEEVKKYNRKKGNFDRIVAAQLAITQANKMDPIYKKLTSLEPKPKPVYKPRPAASKLFGNASLFGKKTRLF